MHTLRTTILLIPFVSLHLLVAQHTSVAPSPVDQEHQIDSMLAHLSLEQKIDLIGGVSTWYTAAEPAIGIAPIRMSDGPAGLRSGIPAIAYPAPIALAASWDTDLAVKMGAALGRDSRVRGVDLLLGPGVNIARAPMGGRNFEYMGEDPWLASRIAVSYIRGVQSQGVGATVKHFMMNSQEFNRHNASSDADERTKREIYLPAFEAAVKEAHVAAMMDSYNLVDGIHSTQNGWMNNDLVKKEWGFDGIIMSDWVSVYDGVAAASSGLDLEMPFPRFMSRETLLPAIRSGAISEDVINDKVRRILRFNLRYGVSSRTEDDTNSLLSPKSDQTAQQVALESIVLLKNTDSLLPLSLTRTCTLAIIGPNASPAVMGGGGSAIVDTYKSVSILQGISDYVASQSASIPGCTHRVLYDAGWPANYDVFSQTNFTGGLKQQVFTSHNFTGTPQASARDHLNEDRTVTTKTGSIRWSGQFTAPKDGRYFVMVHDGRPADHHAVFVDGEALPSHPTDLHSGLYYLPLPHPLTKGQAVDIRMDYLPADNEVYPGLGLLHEDDILSLRARSIAAHADAVIVTAGFDKNTEHEGMDRTFELPPLQDTLIRNLAALNPKTIVTLNAGGNVDMRAWIDRVPALLHLWYPGEEGGTALAQILFGQHNPEGHLPVSFEYRWEDNPTFHSYYPQEPVNAQVPHIHYTEGIFLGYRYYASPAVNTQHVEPRFPFGYGLSYTTFKFSDLSLSSSRLKAGDPLTVTLTVQNTGKVAGAAVPQIYIAEHEARVPRPAIELKAFQKVNLLPGERRSITFTLNDRSFAYWSETEKDWHIDSGLFTIFAGESSEDMPAHRDVTLYR
ncbi:MAG TPA: glycoside hydrolase family 3 C-terminal domain-containing protein [Acidobacteriaceae bacterium]